MDKKYSNESNKTQDMLNALADGQLPPHERERILSMIDENPALGNEVCEIYRIKDLIKTAYPLNEFKPTPKHPLFSKYLFTMKFASIAAAFVFTLLAGFYLAQTKIETLVNTKVINPLATIQTDKFIVFLSSSEPTKMTQVLYKAETLAIEHQKTNGKVYVVTSAEGLDLLDKSTSPFEQKIAELNKQYPSIKFIACNNTMYKRKKEGKPVNLVADAQIVPSAVDFVATHLLKGWQYVSI